KQFRLRTPQASDLRRCIYGGASYFIPRPSSGGGRWGGSGVGQLWVWAVGGEVSGDEVWREWAGEEVALAQEAAVGAEVVCLVGGFDALGHGVEFEVAAELDQAAGGGVGGLGGGQAMDEGL